MTKDDASVILAIATLAAMADGEQDVTEQAQLAQVARSLGLSEADPIVRSAISGERSLASLATSLSSQTAKQAAYDSSVAVCHADGWISPREATFLHNLATLVEADTTPADNALAAVNRAADDPDTSRYKPDISVDQYILDQAILTAALELLPDHLANLGILPLQLRLVHHIGQLHGQRLDASQVKDLVATLGIGAAAQIIEKTVRRTLGGLAGGILGTALGGLIGNTAGSVAGVATGAAVTFAATYALGHVAEKYYAQGRQLSADDLRALFTRFQQEATTIFPRVEERIGELARSGSLGSVLRGTP